MTVVLLAVIAVLVVANLLNNRWAPRYYVFTSLGTSAVLLGILFAAGLTWADAGLTRWLPGLWWGFACVGLVALAYLLGALLPVTRRWFVDRRVGPADGREIAYQMGVRIPLGTVLLEELAFRGVVYGLAAALYGVWPAIALSSVLFGLWHVLPAQHLSARNAGVARAFGARRVLVVAVAVVASAGAGLVLCELRRRTGSLVPAFSAHWATNALGYLAAFLVTRRAVTLYAGGTDER